MEFLYLLLLILGVFFLVFFYQKLFRSQAHILIKLFFLLLLISFPVSLFFNRSESNTILKPLGDLIEETVESGSESSELEEIIQEELQNAEGKYAISIKNLKTNESYFYNEHEIFETASLYKLWVMGAIFEEIEKGNLTLQQNIGFEADIINKRLGIATESAEITEGFIGNTVEGALDRMITVSDNYSAHILYLTIGWNKVGEFLSKYSLDNSSIDSVTSTANDVLKYYELLYKGEIVSKNASREMLMILKRQQLNDRIPKYLPKNIEIAHKTGELGTIKHDAGIIYSPYGDYVLVLLSQTNNQTTAAEIEAKISEKVYEYFSSQ